VNFDHIKISDAKLRCVLHDKEGVRLSLVMWDGTQRSLFFKDAISCNSTGLFGVDLSHVDIVDAPEQIRCLAEVSGEDLSGYRCFEIYPAMNDDEALARIVALDCDLV